MLLPHCNWKKPLTRSPDPLRTKEKAATGSFLGSPWCSFVALSTVGSVFRPHGEAGLDGTPPPPRRRGLTRNAVVLGCGAGQPARQVRGELGRVAVAARHPQRPHRSAARPAHPARRVRASPPWRRHNRSESEADSPASPS